MLLFLSGLHAVLQVLAPDDPIDSIEIEQRTKGEIEVRVAWRTGDTFSLPLSRGSWSAAQIIYGIFGPMQDYIADHRLAWGEARPPCPGHSHPRNLVLEGSDLRWKCPTDGLGAPAFVELLDSEQN